MSDIPIFLPEYNRKTKEWTVCRISPNTTVTRVLSLRRKVEAMTVCQCLNSVRSELLQSAILSSLTPCKKSTPTPSASCRKSQSKPSLHKVR